MRKNYMARERANEIQKKRYRLCDTKGHQRLDIKKGYCNYCDRHYPQTIQQKIRDKTQGLINIIDELSN